MKPFLLFCFSLLLCSSISAQTKQARITIWKLEKNLKLKGRLMDATDSSITLKVQDSVSQTISMCDIRSIRIKNGFGTNAVLIGGTAATGLGLVGIFLGESPRNDGTLDGAIHDFLLITPAEAGAIGFISGAAAGTAIAGIIAASRGKMKFDINGDPAQMAVSPG